MQGNRAEEIYKLSRESYNRELFKLIGAGILIYWILSPVPLTMLSVVFRIIGIQVSDVVYLIFSAAIFAAGIYVVKILADKKKQKQIKVNEWVASLSESEQESALHTLYFQKEFGCLCMMPDFLYIPSQNEMIGYEKIKRICETTYRIAYIIPLETRLEIVLDGEKPVMVKMGCSSSEFRRRSVTFLENLNTMKRNKMERMNSYGGQFN